MSVGNDDRLHDVEEFDDIEEMVWQIKKGRSICCSILPDGEEGAVTYFGLDEAVKLRSWLDRAIAVMDGTDPGVQLRVAVDTKAVD